MSLTIIIPMYNVEQYIAKCILSVLKQDWHTVDFDLLVIDDASPDNSLLAVQKLQAQYPNKITIISQENKGLGGARNTAIDNAKGDFLFFLDSDDYLINNKLPSIYQIANVNKLDIIEFAAARVDTNGKIIDTIFHLSTDNEILNSSGYLRRIDFANSACNKIYRKQFLIENNIKFFEKTYVEDAPFNTEAISKANKLMAIDEIPVAYLQNPKSITRTKKSKERQLKFINDGIKVTAFMNNFANYHEDEVAQKRIKAKIASFIAGIILAIAKAPISKLEKYNFLKVLKQHNLYPCPYKSNVFQRNLFLKIVNIQWILKLMLKV